MKSAKTVFRLRIDDRIAYFKSLWTTKPIRRYEFYLFEGNQTMVDRDVKKMQDEGWELAGEISTKFSEHGMNRMLIPLKRKL